MLGREHSSLDSASGFSQCHWTPNKWTSQGKPFSRGGSITGGCIIKTLLQKGKGIPSILWIKSQSLGSDVWYSWKRGGSHIYPSSWTLEGVGLGVGVPILGCPPRLCFIFLEVRLSGEENGDLEGLLSTSGRVNSWYHSGRSTWSRFRASQKSGRSTGVRSICCLPTWVTIRAKGKSHVCRSSFPLICPAGGAVLCDSLRWFVKGLGTA